MYIGLHAKYLLFMYAFNENTLSRQIFENTQEQNCMKIRPVVAQLFHAENRRTDMMKLIVVFRNFANAPKNW